MIYGNRHFYLREAGLPARYSSVPTNPGGVVKRDAGSLGVIFVKLYKAAGVILLLITVSLTLFLVSTKNSAGPAPGPDKESANDVKNIMGKIDARVKEVKDRLNGEFYRDHYDRDNLMFRYFDRGVEGESLAVYDLYYDEQGKLIYADIAHYRGALYSIYFHNNELLHVEVGPSLEGGLSINGGMEEVEAVVKKDSSFNFVQEDISSCLESAYK